jgi:hypothetical protein
MINKIISYRRANNISLQDGEKLESFAETIIRNETLRCIEIYKAEYSQYGFSECRGNSEAVNLILKVGDCSGGTKGLGIGKDLNVFLKYVYSQVEEFNVKESDTKNNPTYDGSEKDQFDFFLQLKEKEGIDLDYVRGALAHEAKHTYGLIGGNTFIKEGITEQTTREDCDKYGMYMSPTSHTQEANFIRKLELVVGRDEVVKAGLYNAHEEMKKQRFKQIVERDKNITEDELNEVFEILRYDENKIDEHDSKENDETKKLRPKLEKFKELHPELLDEINSIRAEYDKMNKYDRYDSISAKFNDKIARS